MKKSLLIAGAAIMAVAVPAIAATQATRRPPPPMAQQDITRAEVEAKVKEQFALFDANKDGTVTRDEITARRDAMRAQWQDERFKALDQNGDGSISRAEFDAAHQDRGPRGPRPDGSPPMAGNGPDGAPPPAGAMADGGPDAPPPPPGKGGRHEGRHDGFGRHGRMGPMMGGGMFGFALADADKNGQVTLAEATSAALARFDRMDANKDGKLTAQERRDAMKQMRGHGRKDGPRKPPAAAAQPS